MRVVAQTQVQRTGRAVVACPWPGAERPAASPAPRAQSGVAVDMDAVDRMRCAQAIGASSSRVGAYQRAEWRSITPRPSARRRPPGNVPVKTPNGWT